MYSYYEAFSAGCCCCWRNVLCFSSLLCRHRAQVPRGPCICFVSSAQNQLHNTSHRGGQSRAGCKLRSFFASLSLARSSSRRAKLVLIATTAARTNDLSPSHRHRVEFCAVCAHDWSPPAGLRCI